MKHEKETKIAFAVALVALALFTALFIVDIDKDLQPDGIEEFILDALVLGELLTAFLLVKSYIK